MYEITVLLLRTLRFPYITTCETTDELGWVIIWLRSVPVLSDVKGKAVPLQAWTGPEGSREFRFPDFVTTA